MFSSAEVGLANGVPFVSDDDLEAALDDAGVAPAKVDAVVETNTSARIDGLLVSLAILALIAVSLSS